MSDNQSENAPSARETALHQAMGICEVWMKTQPVLENARNPELVKMFASVTRVTAEKIRDQIRDLLAT